MTTKQLKQAADQFLTQAFQSALYIEPADRLVLTTKDGKNMGGWCKEALRGKLYALLEIEEPTPQ